MLSRLRSFRIQLLAATAVTAVVGLVGADLTVALLQSRDNHASDKSKARQIATELAADLAHGAPVSQIRFAQTLLSSDQVVVFRSGRVVFSGPPLRNREVEGVEQAAFPGGRVVVHRHTSSSDSTPATLTAIFAVVVSLVIAAAALVSSLLARRVRRPLDEAVSVASRVTAGDYTARLGTFQLDEFQQFGRAFDEMAARLERSDREQRRFLADVTHELATPLSSLVGFAAALADGTASSTEDRAEAAEMIGRESHRLVTLLQALRELTRVDLFESVHAEPVRLDRFTAEIAARFAPQLEDAQLTQTLELNPVETTVDPRVLESVVRNLLANAIQYTPPGGTVTLSTYRRGHDAVLVVQDTGIGIPPEEVPRVFDRLYRVDEARSTASGGSGLGLSIAARATSALGGRIEVESAPGEGTEFRVVLPARGRSRPRLPHR
jgi:signal transduction histidine kinase